MTIKREPDDQNVGGVQAIERALILLEQLAAESSGRGRGELSKMIGQRVGNIQRLVMTLRARGYETRDGRSRRYTLGPACHLLATRVQSMPDWKTLATPLLQQLVEL